MLKEVASAAAAVAEEERIAQEAAKAQVEGDGNSAPTPSVRQAGKRGAASAQASTSSSSATQSTSFLFSATAISTKGFETKAIHAHLHSAKALAVDSPAPIVRRSKRLRAGSDLESPMTQQLPQTQYEDFSQVQVSSSSKEIPLAKS